jgi:hypothetical protein
MQSPKMPMCVELHKGGFRDYEPLLKFRFAFRFLPVSAHDQPFLIHRIRNITELERDLPPPPTPAKYEVDGATAIHFLNTKRYVGPPKLVDLAKPSPPFKQTLEISYHLGVRNSDLGLQIGDRKQAEILLLDPMEFVAKVIKFSFGRTYLMIPDLDHSGGGAIERKLILCDVSEFEERLPETDTFLIYKDGSAAKSFETKEEVEEWLTLDARTNNVPLDHQESIDSIYQVYRHGECLKIKSVIGGDRLFIAC